MTALKQIRTKAAILRFAEQLESGKKTIGDSTKIELSDKDIKRIKRDIDNKTFLNLKE